MVHSIATMGRWDAKALRVRCYVTRTKTGNGNGRADLIPVITAN